METFFKVWINGSTACTPHNSAGPEQHRLDVRKDDVLTLVFIHNPSDQPLLLFVSCVTTVTARSSSWAQRSNRYNAAILSPVIVLGVPHTFAGVIHSLFLTSAKQ